MALFYFPDSRLFIFNPSGRVLEPNPNFEKLKWQALWLYIF